MIFNPYGLYNTGLRKESFRSDFKTFPFIFFTLVFLIGGFDLGIDEYHQALEGHWDCFRPEMAKVISTLRIYRSPGSPTVAMTATSTDSEVASTISNLGFRSDPIVLKSSPVQNNLKLVCVRRPPNVAGADGFEDVSGAWHSGYLASLKVLLDKYISDVQAGRPVKKGLIFCRYVLILFSS